MKDPLELELGVGSLLLHSTMIVPLHSVLYWPPQRVAQIVGLQILWDSWFNDYTGNLSPHSCDCLVCFIIILFYNGDIIVKYNPCQYSGKHSHSLSLYDPSIQFQNQQFTKVSQSASFTTKSPCPGLAPTAPTPPAHQHRNVCWTFSGLFSAQSCWAAWDGMGLNSSGIYPPIGCPCQ